MRGDLRRAAGIRALGHKAIPPAGDLRENLHTLTDWGLDETVKLLVSQRELLVRIVVTDLNSISLGTLSHHVKRFESSANKHLPDGQVLRIYVVGRNATTRPTVPPAPPARTSYRAVDFWRFRFDFHATDGTVNDLPQAVRAFTARRLSWMG
jgi:hypothetical protein